MIRRECAWYCLHMATPCVLSWLPTQRPYLLLNIRSSLGGSKMSAAWSGLVFFLPSFWGGTVWFWTPLGIQGELGALAWVSGKDVVTGAFTAWPLEKKAQCILSKAGSQPRSGQGRIKAGSKCNSHCLPGAGWVLLWWGYLSQWKEYVWIKTK